MVLYSKDEIIPLAKLSQELNLNFDKLRDKKLNKLAIIRDNHIEAVLLPIDLFENLVELIENIEANDINMIIKEYN